METNKLHRVPVLVGILSLADIAREARYEHAANVVEVSDLPVAAALEEIGFALLRSIDLRGPIQPIGRATGMDVPRHELFDFHG